MQVLISLFGLLIFCISFRHSMERSKLPFVFLILSCVSPNPSILMDKLAFDFAIYLSVPLKDNHWLQYALLIFFL